MESNSQQQLPWLLCCDDVAALLQVTRDTIQNLHRVRQLRGVKVGKHLRWRPEDVRSFVEGLAPVN